MSVPIANLTRAGVNLMFSQAVDLTHSCYYCRVLSPIDGLSDFVANPVQVDVIFALWRDFDIRGSRTQPADERGLVEFSSFDDAGLPLPQSGDYFIRDDGAIYDVVNCRLDNPSNLVTLQLRKTAVDYTLSDRVFLEDFGAVADGSPVVMDFDV